MKIAIITKDKEKELSSSFWLNVEKDVQNFIQQVKGETKCIVMKK